ncbi:MAG: YgiQ family radical SAM protein [Gammaproteobacteria bacterium]|nr:YgiQ family radical SAM protein [Gammaproteobacteria bacterium]
MSDYLSPDKRLFDYPKYWAECFGPAPFLPMSKAEMEQLGWDSCDIILVTGDAYVDHPSFGMAIIGRLLEAQGFRVGIIAQPAWEDVDAFKVLGKPNLYFGVTAGNMDSMINRYTADRRLRHDDAYTPGNVGGKRPDRATLIYTQRCKQAFKGVPVIIGGIEASLRRIAHYDYWSEKVRRSMLVESKADLLIYGNAERPLVEVSQRLAAGENIATMRDVLGTAVLVKQPLPGWRGKDSTDLDQPGHIDPIPSPYADTSAQQDMTCNAANEKSPKNTSQPLQIKPMAAYKPVRGKPWHLTYAKLPAFATVKADPVMYAHASRVMHHETNPGCARALYQEYGPVGLWVNPPAMPLDTEEMDYVFAQPYARVPHPIYKDKKIPAYEMIRFSVNIMRGCFGGCSFCSITEHEGRIIQNRSEDSIIQEVEAMRDKVPGFTGVVSDLGGPTANMYRLQCQDPKVEATCRRASCVHPTICSYMGTDHKPLISLYRRTRNLPGIKKVLIASGLRYDLAIRDPEYVKELVTHHVGGYLKIAPEHTEEGPLAHMLKPGMGSYNKFKRMFDKYSKEAGKEQYLIPYFISAHPGTRDIDMVNLALWLKRNKFRLDQVQNFYPSPMCNATTMYHTELNPLKKISRDGERVSIPRGIRQRRLHKAILRYHDPKNWQTIRDALATMGLHKLIGKGPDCLVPAATPAERRQTVSKAGKGKQGMTRFSSPKNQKMQPGKARQRR